ncbi:MAG: hypothetical protein JWM90_57 [Thermoleophilia bacterium]|nr:hypothetical protein [Thermoleophilia bacterium]
MPERDPINELLWNAWGALGVSTWSVGEVQTVIDPEVLIAATATVGDERLFLETVDWGILHASLLLPHRLRRLARETDVAARVEGWIATVNAATADVSWTAHEPPIDGFVRSGKSMRFPDHGPHAPAAAALRSRVMLGPSVRSEVVRSLHSVAVGIEPSLAAVDVAWRAASTKSQVNGALEDLVGAGLVIRQGTPKRRRYAPQGRSGDAIASGLWTPWSTYAYGPWREALRLLVLLDRIRGLAAGTATISAAVEARAHFAHAATLLGSIDATWTTDSPQGSAATVLPAAAALAADATERLADRLTLGSRRSA